MKIDLTKQQINILYQLVLNANWNGAQVEVAVELKKKLKESIDKINNNHIKEEENNKENNKDI